MQVITPELIRDKRVLLRLDFDVPLKQLTMNNEQLTVIEDDSRLLAGLPTLDLCLQYAKSVIIMGHLGRPDGKEVPDLSVKPVVDWFEERFSHINLEEGKLHILENLRFEEGEDIEAPQEKIWQFARELAELGDVFINDSFAAHHKATSTTILPTLMPHAAGLRFAKEVEVLLSVRNSPKKLLVSIIGGAKVEDKYEAIVALSKISEAVLVGGLLPKEIKDKGLYVGSNVLLGKLNEAGTDLASETVEAFEGVIEHAKQIIWAGPMGKTENEELRIKNNGTSKIAEAILASGAESIIGGGDTAGVLKELGLLEKFSFVSSGGGAMLKLLVDGTLPTIEALT